MTELRTSRSYRSDQDRKLRKYFSTHAISRNLGARVRKYVVARLRSNDVHDGYPICLNMLPPYLRDELQESVYAKLLVQHPFFAAYRTIGPEAMRKLCGTAIHTVCLQDAEVLFGYGDVDSELMMIFVCKGRLFYWPAEHYPLAIEISRGEWACEACLWADFTTLSGPIVADRDGCQVLKINPDSFKEVTRAHKETHILSLRYAESFVQAFNDFSNDADGQIDDLVFNDRSLIEAILGMARGRLPSILVDIIDGMP